MRTITKIKPNPNLNVDSLEKLVEVLISLDWKTEEAMKTLHEGIENLKKRDALTANKEIYTFMRALKEEDMDIMDALDSIFVIKKDVAR